MSLGCLVLSEVAATPDPGIRPVRLRALNPDDGAILEAIFTDLGPRSRQQRFLAPKSSLTSADLRQLTAVDGRDHVALVAETTDGRPIGVARFVRDAQDPQSADVAVAVVDDWQQRGVGTALAVALARCAGGLGVRRTTLAMLVGNEGANRLMHRIADDIELLGIESGIAEFAISVPDPASPLGSEVLTGSLR